MSTLLPTSSALSEASPDSLSELFSRHPSQLSLEDEDKIVMILREQRARFAAAQASGAKTPKAIKAALPQPILGDDELML